MARRSTRAQSSASVNHHRSREEDNASSEPSLDPDLASQPYCSHACLNALANETRGDQWAACPNLAKHQTTSSTLADLRRRLAEQVFSRDAPTTAASALYSGPRSVVFKTFDVVSGYCFIAKGFKDEDHKWLQLEKDAYSRLQSHQGQMVPVCCGSFSLNRPIERANREVSHVLLLSYGGISIIHLWIRERSLSLAHREILLANLHTIHSYQIIHGDPELRNILWDEVSDRILFVDFEHSRLYDNRPPCEPGEACRKRYKDRKGRRRDCVYCAELRHLEGSMRSPHIDDLEDL